MDPNRPKRVRRGERGAVLVEFSLVVVLFVALLYGLIAFGMALALKQSMTNAASEGARTAVGAAPDDRQDVAWETIEGRLDWLGDKMDALGVPGFNQPYVGGTAVLEEYCDENPFTGQTGVGSPGERCIWVRLVYDYDNYPLVPTLALPGFGYLFPSTITADSAVQMPPDES